MSYLSTIYLSSAQEKSQHKLLHFSYLREINFQGDKLLCELIFTGANIATFCVDLFSEIEE